MDCLRAEKIADHLCDPLQRILKDEDLYVRKTTTLCVAKLYDLKPELVISNGFLEQLFRILVNPWRVLFVSSMGSVLKPHRSWDTIAASSHPPPSPY